MDIHRFRGLTDRAFGSRIFKVVFADRKSEPMSQPYIRAAAAIAAMCLTACQAVPSDQGAGLVSASTLLAAARTPAQIQADRQAIKAMAGNFDVKFDFLETVALTKGYEPKERYVSGGHEVVRVIVDEPGFISLQHILVVGGEDKMAIKHWRQDWIYEPAEVLTFIGGNAWEMRPVSPAQRAGKWAQVVYQVDDSPRYGAVAAWSHENGVSQWVPPAEMRPLPRRDMTTRDDYHAVLAVNRHAITPTGWVHEQDNSKLVLDDDPNVLVREVGVNTYTRFDDFDVAVAESYWAETAEYWKMVRAAWSALEQTQDTFALTLKGEPEDLYNPLLEMSFSIQEGTMDARSAAVEARKVIKQYTTGDLPPLAMRLRGADEGGGAYENAGAR